MAGYIICPIHGDLYVDHGANVGSLFRTDRVKPLRDDVPQPTNGTPFRCPLCGGPLGKQVRPS